MVHKNLKLFFIVTPFIYMVLESFSKLPGMPEISFMLGKKTKQR